MENWTHSVYRVFFFILVCIFIQVKISPNIRGVIKGEQNSYLPTLLYDSLPLS